MPAERGPGESVDFAGACKYFGAKAALSEVSLRSSQARSWSCWPVRLRQDDPVALPGRHRAPEPGHHLHWRPGRRRARAHVPPSAAAWPWSSRTMPLAHMTALRNVAFPLRQLRIGGHDARGGRPRCSSGGPGPLGERYPTSSRAASSRECPGPGTGRRGGPAPVRRAAVQPGRRMREQLRLAISTLARDSGATRSTSPTTSPKRSPWRPGGVRNCSRAVSDGTYW